MGPRINPISFDSGAFLIWTTLKGSVIITGQGFQVEAIRFRLLPGAFAFVRRPGVSVLVALAVESS